METTPAKQKPDRIIKVPKKTLKFWREQLARKYPNNERPYGETMDEVAKSFSIAGTKYEVVLKLVNSEPDRAREASEAQGGLGEPPGGPYLDAILFADGLEQCVLEPSRECLEGRYEFRDSVEGRDVVVEVHGPPIKKHVLHRKGWKTEWWMEDGEVCVSVYKEIGESALNQPPQFEEKPCLEWAFPKIPGNNILGCSSIFLEQAIMYAQNPPSA